MRTITGKFLKVKCIKCNNEQNIYTKAASEVKCLVCKEVLAINTGGTCDVVAKVLNVQN